MRQLIDDYIRSGCREEPRQLSNERENEIKTMVDCSKTIKYRVNNFYRKNFEEFKSQWHDANLPGEHQSDFWEELLDYTQHDLMVMFKTNLPEIKTKSEEYFAKWDCICEGYLKSDEFSLVIKQLKNDWKKELLVNDFQ